MGTGNLENPLLLSPLVLGPARPAVTPQSRLQDSRCHAQAHAMRPCQQQQASCPGPRFDQPGPILLLYVLQSNLPQVQVMHTTYPVSKSLHIAQ
jgi:hypothetical protein